MGTNTCGYVKGIELLPLIGLVNTALSGDWRTSPFIGVTCKVPVSSTTITHVYYDFDYDLRVSRASLVPVLSEEAESRHMYVGVHEETSGCRLPEDFTSAGSFGALNLGANENAIRIMSHILSQIKAKGYEVYLHEYDTLGRPEKL